MAMIPTCSLHSQIRKIMKKFIFVINAIELLKQLLAGKRVEGVLYFDKNAGRLTFKAYNRTCPKHPKLLEVLIRKTPYGRVTKTPKRFKRYTSIPVDMPFAKKLDTLDEENKLARESLVDYEILERV